MRIANGGATGALYVLGNGSSRGVERPPLPGGGAVSLASAAAGGAGVVAGVAGGLVCFSVCVWAAVGWTSATARKLPASA